MGGEDSTDGVRRQLAVHMGGGADLVARGLDGPGFMDVDVARIGGDGCFPGPQSRGNDRLIGLGAAHQKMDVGIGTLEPVANLLSGLPAVGVQPIAHGGAEIGPVQRFHHLGQRALGVVVAEKIHGISILFLKDCPLIIRPPWENVNGDFGSR